MHPLAGLPVVLRGQGAAATGSALSLPGSTTGNQTPAAISAYLDLPNGLVSSKTDLTVESWATPFAYQSFQRLLDFGRVVQTGDGAPGEITGLTTATLAFDLPENRAFHLETSTARATFSACA